MSKYQGFTFGFLTECFDVDFQRGLLFWKVRPSKHFATEQAWKTFNKQNAGAQVGYVSPEGRCQVRLLGRRLLSYRIIYALYHRISLDDLPPVIDHKDGNASNNSISNLRAADPQKNQFNRRAKVGTASRFKGVTLMPSGRWRASICVRGDYQSLGTFQSEEQAARAYDSAAIKLHGEFARIQVA
jgi:hypothetical protein